MAATPNKTARPRIAWLCSYVPRELILAAGLEPVRLTGRVESIKAAGDRLLHNFCPYLKNVLDSVLRDECQDLAGLILAHSCDGARRLSELLAGRLPFIYFLDLPKNADENGLKYYAARLADLKSRLEEAFDTTVSAADLDRAISVMNDRRRAMLSLFEGQRADPAPIRGGDLWAWCQRESAWTGADFRPDVEAAASPADAARIMILGNPMDRPDLLRMVEDAGGAVVVFDDCLGLPHYSMRIEDGPDPIASLARGYLDRPPCARWPDFRSRMQRVRQLVRDFRIDGIIHSGLTFCDYSMFETPLLAATLKEDRVPLLVIENDYLWSDAPRIQTRVEAFLEMVTGDW